MIFYLRCAAYLDRFRELGCKTAASDTLTRSGYARFDNENQSTALPWSFLSLSCWHKKITEIIEYT